MAYIVLARRYRSQTFDEVVGQECIAKTLKNAIALDRVAHAYLFTGTRGVGKTSMARIFAKALNALDDKGNEIPEVAAAIMAGCDTDVIEIDAASNRSVEEARQLIANSVYRPLRGRRKVYIIDEVHMLTREAFNALLKTMEEPPDHVVFILCTTETHKVPATIQSRCQRFDFRNIATARIADHLAAVVKNDGAQAEPELLHMVARLGNGSMRDALSLMDRLIASGEKKLTAATLQELLGLPDHDVVLALVDTLAEGDAAGALGRADELLRRDSGDQLLETLAGHFRDLMVLAACGPETELVELTADARRRAAEQAARFDPAGLVHMIAICESVQQALRTTSSPRALVDAAIVRLAMTEKLADVTAIVTGSVATAARNGSAGGGGAPAKKH